MSIFGAIVDRIFHHSTATAAGNQTAQAGGGTSSVLISIRDRPFSNALLALERLTLNLVAEVVRYR